MTGFNEAMLYGKTSKDAPATLLKQKEIEERRTSTETPGEERQPQ